MYELFEHTADVGLRIRAATLPLLFADAARGFFSLIVANLEEVQPVIEKTLHVPGHEEETDYWLFDWLSELLYTFDTERVLFSRFDVQLTDQGLRATCRGEPMDASRHDMHHEIKAITYHGLTARPTDSGWLAEVIVDI